jgi:hypothetical protein
MVVLGGKAEVAEPPAQLVPVENDPSRTKALDRLFARPAAASTWVGCGSVSSPSRRTAELLSQRGTSARVADG